MKQPSAKVGNIVDEKASATTRSGAIKAGGEATEVTKVEEKTRKEESIGRPLPLKHGWRMKGVLSEKKRSGSTASGSLR
ncbi:hypothetical protein BHM03_00043934 [Ensete ventricosum]|nr:hypothetical protein BHM03_00043934 [Ensete ventricosum]